MIAVEMTGVLEAVGSTAVIYLFLIGALRLLSRRHRSDRRQGGQGAEQKRTHYSASTAQ